MAKTETTKDILKEAKEEIFEGKSLTVKNKFQTLLGTVDGVKARRALTIAKLDKELADVEAEVAKYAAMDVEEAFNTITVENQNSQVWNVGCSSYGYPLLTMSSATYR